MLKMSYVTTVCGTRNHGKGGGCSCLLLIVPFAHCNVNQRQLDQNQWQDFSYRHLRLISNLKQFTVIHPAAPNGEDVFLNPEWNDSVCVLELEPS